MKPLVSVGLPFFNPGVFFADAIRSVFAQTSRDWELILIDDGSTDGSLDMARQIRSDRVRVFSDGRNRGLPVRLNEITELARGRYLARMDADDLMHPERLERQLSWLEKNNDHVISTGAWIIDSESRIVGKSRWPDTLPTTPSSLEFLKWGGVIHATIMARHEWFLQNPYDLGYPRAEDRKLFVSTFRNTKIWRLPEKLYFHRYAGRLNPQAFFQGYSSERRILRRYGPPIIGLPRTTFLILRSKAKSATLRAASAAGVEDRIMKQTYLPIGPAERDEAESAYEKIISTPVVGWDGTSL